MPAFKDVAEGRNKNNVMRIISLYCWTVLKVNMAADDCELTFALPDLSGLSEAERLQVIVVMQKAKVGVS